LGIAKSESEKERVLLDFLERLDSERVSTLYVLGDLFDFWIEYNSAVLSQHFRVLAELARTVQRGIEVHFIVGNHDFWAGDFLRNTIGMKVHDGPIEIEFDGQRVYLCHGDGLNPYDRGYHLLKTLVRSRIITWIARRVHPDTVTWLARWFSRMSREGTSVAGKLREDESIRQFALQKFHDGIDVVIAAHSHQPHDERHSVDGAVKRFYNVGDMCARFTYLEYSRGEFRLKSVGRGNPPA
jgi:UDP-2,3-diacylglucosamine hydrolase